MNAAAAIAAEVAAVTIANGGTTFDLQALHPVTSGVAAALPGHEHIVPVATEAEVAEAVADYLAAHADVLASGAALGTWLHAGSLYLDAVQVTSLDEAEAAAAANGELAIFVLDTQTELPIPTTALHVA